MSIHPLQLSIFRELMDNPAFALMAMDRLSPDCFFGGFEQIFTVYAKYHARWKIPLNFNKLEIGITEMAKKLDGYDVTNCVAALDAVRTCPANDPNHYPSLITDTETLCRKKLMEAAVVRLANATDATNRAAQLEALRAMTEAIEFSFVGTPTQGRHLTATTCDEIVAERVDWLWTHRLACGALCLLAGREGLGKSLITTDLIAKATNGRLDGFYVNSPRDCIIIATEDSFATTIVPRLTAAGANLKRVHQVTVTMTDVDGTHDEALVLPADITALTTLIQTTGAVLVVLDPLTSRLDQKLDSHKDADVRRALEPLTKMAATTGVTILGIIHLNKGTDRDMLNNIMGSKAFTAVPRCTMSVYPEPNHPDIRVLIQSKNNLGACDSMPLLPYTIQANTYTTAQGITIETASLKWLPPDVSRNAVEFLATKATPPEAADKLAGAKKWLTDYLGTSPGRSSKQAKEDADFKGFSEGTLKRAARELNVVQFQDVQARGHSTLWRLPTSPLADIFKLGRTKNSV
jgi:hypothetical protein